MKKFDYNAPLRQSNHNPGEKRKRKKIIITLLLFFTLLIAASVYLWIDSRENKDTVDKDTGNELLVTLQSEQEGNLDNFQVSTVKEITIEEEMESYFNDMSLEEKLCQLIITTPEGLLEIGQLVQAEEATKRKIRQYPVGGILFSDINFETTVQANKLVNSFLVYSKYPIFTIMTDSAKTRIENTGVYLGDINVKMVYESGVLQIVDGQELKSVSEFKVKSNISPEDMKAGLFDKVDMLFVDSNFITVYQSLYSAVNNGDIPMEIIDEKVKLILEYKIINNIQ